MPAAVFLSAYSIPQISSVVHKGFMSILWIIRVGTSVTRLTAVGRWATRTARPLLRSLVVKAKSRPVDQDGFFGWCEVTFSYDGWGLSGTRLFCAVRGLLNRWTVPSHRLTLR